MMHVDALELTLRPHEGAILSARLSPDGAHVLTGSNDASIQISDAYSGRPRLKLYEQGLMDTTFSPSGREIVSTTANGNVRVWDIATGELGLDLNNGEWNVSAEYSRDGKMIVTATLKGTAWIWDAATAQALLTLRGHNDRLTYAAFSPDGRKVVTASDDATARLWDASTGRTLTTLRGHSGSVTMATFSPDGTLVATSSVDRMTRLWSADSGAAHRTLRGHHAAVHTVEFSPDGRYLVTGSADKTARVWHVDSGNEVFRLSAHDGPVLRAAFSSDGSRLVTAGTDKAARVWRVERAMEGRFAQHRGSVHAVFSSHGESLFVWDEEGIARLYDATTGGEKWHFAGMVSSMTATFSPDDKHIVVGAYFDTSNPMILNAESGALEHELSGHLKRVFGVSVAPDSCCVVTASHDGAVRLWDAATGQLIGDPIGRPETGEHAHSVLAADVAPNGMHLAIGDGAGRIQVRDIATRRVLLEFQAHANTVGTVLYSPTGGRFLSTGWRDHLVKVWDASTGDLLVTMEGHPGMIYWASWSPDEQVIATTGGDNVARFWDATSGDLIHEVSGPKFTADFNHDGTAIAVGGDDGYARVVRLEARSPGDVGAIIEERVDWIYRDGKLVRRSRPAFAPVPPDGGSVAPSSSDRDP